MSALRFDWERQLRSAALAPHHRFTALVLATYAGPDGAGARPGEANLAQATGKTPRTVRRHLDALRSTGWVARVCRGSSRGTRGAADVYQLTIPITVQRTSTGIGDDTPSTSAPPSHRTPGTARHRTSGTATAATHRTSVSGTTGHRRPEPPDIGVRPPCSDHAETMQGDARAGQGRPPATCLAHRDMAAAGPCAACGDHRRTRQAWDSAQAHAATVAAVAARRAAAQRRAAQIAACSLCDERGYTGTVWCDHDPTTAARAARGLAAARAAVHLNRGRSRRAPDTRAPLPGQRPLIGVVTGEGQDVPPAPPDTAPAAVASTGRHHLPDPPHPLPAAARAVTALLADELTRRRTRHTNRPPQDRTQRAQ
ncbi:MAG: hypothetical protein ACRDTG_29260 [Pseudonocardiaceae bacterium]